MPVKKPEITGYGTYFINLGIEVREIIIWKIEASNKTKTIDLKSPFNDRTIVATIIALGPVGPDTIGILEPKIPVNNDNIIAPKSPAQAPNTEATPKAKACGKAIIEAVIAPNKSPFKCCLNLSMA